MLLCLTTLLWVGTVAPGAGPMPALSADAVWMDLTPTRDQARVFLARLGITPEAACAAGVTVGDVEGIFQAAADTLDALRPSIEAADAAVAAARTDLAAIRAGGVAQSGASLQTTIQQAEVALTTALASQTLLNTSAFESATAPIQGAVRTRLAAIRVNQEQSVPVEFKVITRTAAEWKALQGALKHVQSRQACGLTAAPERAAEVASAATDTEVALAKGRLDSLLQQMRAVWTPVTEP